MAFSPWPPFISCWGCASVSIQIKRYVINPQISLLPLSKYTSHVWISPPNQPPSPKTHSPTQSVYLSLRHVRARARTHTQKHLQWEKLNYMMFTILKWKRVGSPYISLFMFKSVVRMELGGIWSNWSSLCHWLLFYFLLCFCSWSCCIGYLVGSWGLRRDCCCPLSSSEKLHREVNVNLNQIGIWLH